MRADSPVVLVMKNWLPYSLSASRNTAGILRRPFSSTFAGQLPRSFMRPNWRVDATAPSHHSPLRLSTPFYCFPLRPTLCHIIGPNLFLSRQFRNFREKSFRESTGRRVCENAARNCGWNGRERRQLVLRFPRLARTPVSEQTASVGRPALFTLNLHILGNVCGKTALSHLPGRRLNGINCCRTNVSVSS